ncbi:uncharacterized protein E0L32_012360 [Thyridium curvatum]|uniref:leucine--tRNA ligase n=1 Tax=Thyridium curvatum TaxID=1093900 RepID=A0A507BJF6_9PEZI|nr:uncharacterized protein E0L32_012360 [Thyridium curvatum]TPX16808.1 hypothetical protein E0L32_012360 [Thyridium curvatum]
MAAAAPTQAMSGLQIATASKTKELKGTEKRDSLITIEKKYQQAWEEDHLFEPDAPSTRDFPLHTISPAELREKYPKYFGCIAYPYMNGVLHVGHAFSYSKVEFTIGFNRMLGKRTLFPQGFHCTGLPIKACADKLADEIKLFGQEFENYKEEEEVVEVDATKAVAQQGSQREDVTKFSATKGKAAAKTVKAKYQFQIMKTMGIPKEEIHRFSDASYWLEYFPPLCKQHLTSLGCRIDWRRQFVTTDANPYYDRFVSWQMTLLRDLKKVKFGKRYTIYSVKDGQPCMDHDRSEGEGVGPQEYTALKLRVLEWSSKAADAIKGKIPEDASVFLVPATLRPETMYGQTCCFIGPKITYGLFKASEKEYYVVTARAAKNMAFQGILAADGAIPEAAAELVGSDMVGTLVNAPLSVHKDGVRVLPMENVLPTKGTGVVTSVPSDSPDDFCTVTELAKKPEYYGIQKEWAEKEIVPIIDTPSYGDLCAPFLVKKLKIASPKDVKQLEEAKNLAYTEGFYKGVMKVGDHTGLSVEKAKPLVRQSLIDAGEAFAYAEPEKKVVSRSGDECITALLDQWYLDYGEDSWRREALKFVENADGKGLNTYTSETKHAFVGVLNWLNQWACARTYGLGSKLPWDPQFLVESLSDSTIYMSYYTFAHYLHSDMFGRQKGIGNIAAEQMIDPVWDYLFCRRDMGEDVLASGIPRETLEDMRRQFEYFYPLDLRVSGKDLINNHLTFCIYNHLAIFPREYWIKSIRCNGHLLLNGQKMSKSTGNFMTLDEATKKFGADATRLALADAGDTIGDANFDEDVADATILRLFTSREWIEDTLKDEAQLRTGATNSFQDALFRNELHRLVHEAKGHYVDTNYKLAVQSSWYNVLSALSFYRESCAAAGIALHKDLIYEYIELQALMLTPITPHWSEYIWLEVLKKPQSIQLARWPEVPAAKAGLSAEWDYAKGTASSINSAESQQLKRRAKGKATSYDPKQPKKLSIYTTDKFPAWQEKYIELMKEMWDPATRSVDDKAMNPRIAKMGEMKKAMPFVQNLKRRLQTGEEADSVLNRKLAFDEQATLLAMVPGLKRTAGFQSVAVILVEEGGKKGKDLMDGGKEVEITSALAENAVPGDPTFFFENVAA